MPATTDATARDAGWEDLTKRRRRTLLASTVARSALTVAGLLVIYAMLPIGREATLNSIGVMVIGSVVVVITVALELRALSNAPHPILRLVETLTSVLVVFILVFATVYLSMAQANTSSFTEPITKVSAVYFTVTVLATVGFGDITPITDAARIAVTVQMVLGLTLVAVVVRFLITYAQNLRNRQTPNVTFSSVESAPFTGGDATSPNSGPTR
jgi:voltage-gated potassium channel